MENLRLYLFVALGLVLYLMWQAWKADYAPPPVTSTGPAVEQPATQDPSPQPPTAADLPKAPAVPAPTAATDLTPSVSAGQQGYFSRAASITVRTDLLEMEIDTAGADLRKARLLAYPISLKQPDKPFVLFNDALPNIFVAQSGLLSSADAPNHHSVYQADAAEYVLGDGADRLEVPLTWTGPTGVRVVKTYMFSRNSYEVGVRYRIENPTEEPWTARMYGQFQRTQVAETDQPNFVYTFMGGVLSGPDDPYQKIDFADMLEQPMSQDIIGGWAAMSQHYFTAAWVPGSKQTNHYYTKALPGSRYVFGVVTPTAQIAAGGNATMELNLYVGPKVQDLLERAAPNLELTVDYGVLTIIAQPLFWLLSKIHGLVGNWGWAIILVTLLIKLAFFQLSATSYKSMANMRRVQPKLVALKERFGDDKAKLNQAMMELYKKEKINPMGGCLPILVQIPVFISLYWVLLESVELRQASFMFWIQDLSVYDPYFVLPILMGASMVIQQKLNPSPMDPIQQKVMMILPIVFTVMFLYFPSGLVLYWFVNNVLSISQQWVITRRIAPAT